MEVWASWVDGPLQQNTHQIFMLNGTYGWHMDGAQGAASAVSPDIAEIWPVELYLNPHGFLKAAQMPGANPRAAWRWELGEMGRDGAETIPEKVTIVSITVNGKYRMDATINKEICCKGSIPGFLIPFLRHELRHEFTNASYVDVGDGISSPPDGILTTVGMTTSKI